MKNKLRFLSIYSLLILGAIFFSFITAISLDTVTDTNTNIETQN
jgi:hypothetical protein